MNVSKTEIIKDKIMDDVFSTDLSEKEKDFVIYYLESGNARQSYLKAFNGDKKNSSVYAYGVLNRPKVKAEIKRLKKALCVAMDIDPLKYIETQMKIAHADIGDYIRFNEEEVPIVDEEGMPVIDRETGEPKVKKVNRMHLSDSEKLDTSVISEIRQGRDGITIKLMDKMKAWENIKDFFEWKTKKEKETSVDKSILSAINNSTSNTWKKDENIYQELDEALKED